ncbi:MAG: acyl-CoA dehydrogenase [Alphaproteobacteria bacterium]|nr:acyl-CoA dehydrogenase [Alphaproteobacteria bacterium]
MTTMICYIGLAILALYALVYLRKGYAAWVSAGAIVLYGMHVLYAPEGGWFTALLSVYVSAVLIFGLVPLRRYLISSFIMNIAAKILPKISETEDTALKAGTTWFEGEFFSGKPDWKKVKNFKPKKLTKSEKDFLGNQVEKLCAMIDNDEIHCNRELSDKVWSYIKKEKFLGMIIPKKYGGLGFGGIGHSEVVTKISSRSLPTAVMVMVPNSLGPAELLMHYGTKKQKDYYLPRLAVGEEIPCFALTEPHAGSDAANGRSFGTVVKKKIKGKEVVGINLTFDKRYITLAPIATVIGLAFRLYDPKGILGDKEDIGITCALLPRETKGLNVGNRHDPMGVPFPNGTVQGKDVFIELDRIIGGEEYAGQGWRMLMECLAVGRSISLPSLSVGGAELSVRAATAYAQVREQFGVPIAAFEGVQERLVRCAAMTYSMDAMRVLTCGGIDAGEKPSVMSAISKNYLTEGMRTCVNDGMDIMAGSAICQGKANIFGRAYQSIPIGITVEGANILTRSMIVFGQGAIRCHPYLQAETESIQNGDLKAFDKAIFGHLNHFMSNTIRAFILGLTGGYGAPVSGDALEKRYYRKLTRLSLSFASLSDYALLTLGGKFKFKESLSGRFSDALGHLSLAMAALHRYHGEKDKAAYAPVVELALKTHIYEIEQALKEAHRNLPSRFLRFKMGIAIAPLGWREKRATDKDMHAVMKSLTDAKDKVRMGLSEGVYTPKKNDPGLGELEDALVKVKKAAVARKKLNKAKRTHGIEKAPLGVMAEAAKKAGALTAAEAKLIKDADKAMDHVVQVASYDYEAYKAR